MFQNCVSYWMWNIITTATCFIKPDSTEALKVLTILQCTILKEISRETLGSTSFHENIPTPKKTHLNLYTNEGKKEEMKLCSFVLDHEVRTHNPKVLDRFMTKTDYNKIIYFHVSSSLTVCGGRRMRNFTIYILVFALNDDSPLSMNFEARNARWNRRIRSIEGHN